LDALSSPRLFELFNTQNGLKVLNPAAAAAAAADDDDDDM